MTNSSSLTLAGLVLGGTNGTQELTGGALSLTNSSLVGSNAVFDWAGGDLSSGSLTVEAGGILTISNRVTFGFHAGANQSITNGGLLTNNGTVIESDNGQYLVGYGASDIYNNGLWQQAGNGLIPSYGTNVFVNSGTVQQIGSRTTTTIGWRFRTSGLLENKPGGSFSLNWDGPSVINGTANCTGNIAAPLTVVSNAVFNWTSGDLSGGTLTVEEGGTLTITNRITLGFNGGNYQAVTNGETSRTTAR